MNNHTQTMTALLASIDRSGATGTGIRSVELLVPTVLEAKTQLDPQAIADSVTVRVQFEGMLETDLVAIVWFGTPGAGTPDLEPLPGSAAGYVDFKVPVAAVMANDDTVVSLVAALVRDDDQWVSESTPLHIGSTVPRIADLRPIVTRVIASGSDIGANATIIGPGVMVEGIATPSQQIELFDGTVSLGVLAANTDGLWSRSLTALRLGAHTLRAKACYGTHKQSAERIFTCVEKLVIDTSTLTLNGVHLHQASSPPCWAETGRFVANVVATRKATGGIGPVRYSSASNRIATVDNNGVVTSQANGSTRITATDSAGNSVSYPVTCSNNYNLYESGAGSMMTFQQVQSWISGSSENRPIPHNGTTLGRGMLNAMSTQFRGTGTFEHHTGTVNPGSQYTNIILSKPSVAPVQAGPVVFSTKGRALCYRVRA